MSLDGNCLFNKSQKLILENSDNNTVFLVGNGINYGIEGFKEWKKLLRCLGTENTNIDTTGINIGELCKESDITYTEIFDLLWFNTSKTSSESINMEKKRAIQAELAGWTPSIKHINLLKYCKQRAIPVITTNYDLNLEKASKLLSNQQKDSFSDDNIIGNDFIAGLLQKYEIIPEKIRFHHNKHKSNLNEDIPDSDTFLWKYFYSDENRANINKTGLNSYSIRHIHGMLKNPQSIRIGLDDYVELLTKLKRYKTSAFYENKNQMEKEYLNTYSWIDYFFNANLVIFGLGLGQFEIDLRWLLMERARYSRISDRALKTVFVHDGKSNDGTIHLLKGIGIDCILDKEYGIYDYFSNAG
jgi:hypothetical protein